MSADQQRQMQELQHQMARLQTEIDETKQREKQKPTPDFINEPLENNVPIDPENFKEMHAFMFDEPEVYGKWRRRQQELNTDNFTAWRRKFNAHIQKNMADHEKFLAESPYREQDLVAAWGWHDRPLKKLPSIATNQPRCKTVRKKQAPCKSKHVERKQTLSESDDDEPLARFLRQKWMPDSAPSKTDFPQVVFPHDIKNDEQSGSSQQQFVELYNMFKIQQQKIEELEKKIDYDKI